MPTYPEGIIFDLDNTLILSEEIHFEAIRRVASEIFVEIDWKYFQQNYLGKDIRAIFTSILAFQEVEPTKEKLDRLVEEKKEALKKVLTEKKPQPVKGIETFIQEIKAAKIPFTIASGSTKEEAEFLLYTAGLIDHFKKIATIWDVQNPKPEPDIYFESARILQADVNRCIAFEDSATGITAAMESGAYTVGLTTSFPEAILVLKNTHKIIKDYTELSLEDLMKDYNSWQEEKDAKIMEGET